MNKIIYILLFLLVIIVTTGNACSFSENIYQEAFIPKIVKETYRPFARNVRMRCEGFYNQSSTDISNLFRKFGIL
jgi:hypothetical protein